jgi:hypothetical protein
MNDENRVNESVELAEIKPAAEGDVEFAIVNQKGKPKTLLWSIAALTLGILSLVLSALGWAGLIVGILAIVLAVVARVRMGFFNGLIIAALLCSIFGVIFSAATVIIVAIEPEFFNRLLGGLNN